MRKTINPIQTLVNREKYEKIYSGIIQAGSIRKLAKELKIGEATIRDVLKGRRGKVQTNTVTNAIDRYYSNSKSERTKEYQAINKQVKKLPPANQKQIAVKGKFFKYKPNGNSKYITFRGDSRKRVILAHSELNKKTKQVKLTQKDIAILEQISNYDIVRFK